VNREPGGLRGYGEYGMTRDIQGNGRATDRLPDPERAVTDRLDSEYRAVTDRLPGSPRPGTGEHVTDILPRRAGPGTGALSRLGIGPGDLLADRYLVEQGPLAPITGEAEIFRAMDRLADEEVIIKFYLPNVVPKKEVLDRLLNLNHPHIVSLRGYGEWKGRFFEVMEVCKGGSLAGLAPYTEDQLREYLRQIITAMKYCHDQGIIHRDIKPDNIFFKHNPCVCLFCSNSYFFD